MFDPSKTEPVYIAIGYTNLRMGIDGLAGVIANTFHQNPQNNSLFLLCGRRKDWIKEYQLVTWAEDFEREKKKILHFHTTPEQAFEFMNHLIPCRENAFLFRY